MCVQLLKIQFAKKHSQSYPPSARRYASSRVRAPIFENSESASESDHTKEFKSSYLCMYNKMGTKCDL